MEQRWYSIKEAAERLGVSHDTVSRLVERGVRAWFADAREDELFTSVLVLGEVRRGIESIRRRDPTAAIALEQWLARLATTFSDRVLPIDARVADRWGVLNMPNPIPTVDGLLAATALVHDLVLVTRNTRDVERTGVRLLDPTADGSEVLGRTE